MNFEFFLAKRIHFSKEKGDNKRATPPVVRIAIAGIAIGLAVMIVSVAIVVGFKKEVRNKVIGFGAHIQLANFDNNISYEAVPIAIGDSLRDALMRTEGVRHIEVFATKPGIIKTETDFQGIVMKGVDADFDTTFLGNHLVEGQMIRIDSIKISNQALISRHMAKMLHLGCGDSFVACFYVNNQDVRMRKFYIAGIYDTGFSDYDKLFAFCDVKQIRRINGWEENMASGVGIFIDNYNRLDELTEELYFSLIDKKDRLGNIYYIRSIKELNPMIFNWLGILDSNVAIILILMILVSGFTMISGLLIIILERTNMIGILKALGENNYSIRKVFLYVSFFMIVKGMFWGNVIGVSLCFLQSHFHWLKLDPETYYLDSVPIDLNWVSLLLINIGSLAVSLLMMIAPSYFISKIEPAKSIKFE
ncbi:MAG: ABC transporter permease [Tannerella sp.]|jgi:lipoprotein-releasing system permease protein|nr:ABC transporter permease [Tannerella sp.]